MTSCHRRLPLRLYGQHVGSVPYRPVLIIGKASTLRQGSLHRTTVSDAPGRCDRG